MGGYLLAGFIGFILGTVLTCILLCKKNLEVYKNIESKATGSVKNSFSSAKSLYEAQVKAYENGTTLLEDNESVTEEDNAE